MFRPRRYLTFANVTSLLALVFSMTGGALAARHFFTHHYLINSTRQINPKVIRRLHGETGEIGPIGPQGVTGPIGQRGSNGQKGEPAPSALPAGVSESGIFSLRATAKGMISQAIQFRIPLLGVIEKGHVEFVKAGTETKPNCKAPGAATKGYLCVYYTAMTQAGEPKVFNPEVNPRPEGTTGLLGFTLEIMGSGETPVFEGTYTVTGA